MPEEVEAPRSIEEQLEDARVQMGMALSRYLVAQKRGSGDLAELDKERKAAEEIFKSLNNKLHPPQEGIEIIPQEQPEHVDHAA